LIGQAKGLKGWRAGIWIVGGISSLNSCLVLAQPPARVSTQQHPVLTLQPHHNDWVCSVAFSSRGESLVSASTDNVVQSWNVRDGRLNWTRYLERKEKLSRVNFSSDGKTMATGDWDNLVQLWDLETGTLLRTLTKFKQNRRVDGLAFSPDGHILASAAGAVKSSHPGTVELWEVRTGQLQQTLAEHRFRVGAVAFAPDGRTLASGSNDGAVMLWDVQTGKLQATLKVEHRVDRLAFTPDGKSLASAGFYGRNKKDFGAAVKLYDVQSGELKWVQEEFGKPGVEGLFFAPDGRALICDGKLRDAQTGVLERTPFGNPLAFSPDGKLLVTEKRDHTLELWNMESEP